MKKLIKVDVRDGIDRFAFAESIDILVGADGVITVNSPWGVKAEILLTPSECRNALFEERDLWN